MDGLKFDLKFQHSLFRSKSDLDMKEVVIDIPRLNTFIPKNFSGFSKKHKYIFWDTLTEEVKRKLEYLEQHRDSSPLDFLLKREIEKLSKDNQVVTSINTLTGPSSQALTTMANRYDPLNLPVALNAMADNYDKKIKKFGADGDLSTRRYIDCFKDFYDLT